MNSFIQSTADQRIREALPGPAAPALTAVQHRSVVTPALFARQPRPPF